MLRGQVRRRDPFRLDALPRGRIRHPVCDEARQRLLVEMLELAGTAFSEMPARWRGMMRTGFQGTVSQYHVAGCCSGNVPAACRNTIAFGGDADDLFA